MSEISQGNPLDKNRSGKVKIKTTNFPINYHNYGTFRFGENGVIATFNGIAKDKVKVQQILDVNTYSLKAPLLTPITMNRTYVQVPRMAILPNAWDKLYINPKIGNDIDSSRYGTSISATNWSNFLTNVLTELKTEAQKYYDSANQTYTGTLAQLKANLIEIIHKLVKAELIFSNGSLINSIGSHFAYIFKTNNRKTFDAVFDAFWSSISATFGRIAVEKITDEPEENLMVNLSMNSAQDTYNMCNLHQWLELLRDGEKFRILALYTTTGSTITDVTAAIAENMYNIIKSLTGYTETITYRKPYDIATLWAYQLSCAEFFTKDNVDYIYNAELFRQYIGNLIQTILGQKNDSLQSFAYDYNGQKILPDWLSADFFNYVNDEDRTGSAEEDAYIFALFKFNRSLKYNDYFTGARTRPIAIGDTSINVTVDDTVEVIDVVKNIQKQRFLNVVNKIPRDLKGYTKGIMGKDVAPDWHNPLHLATISEAIYGQETENTGADQLTQPQTRTSVLKNEGNRVRIEFNLDRNSIIIGIINFDIPRAYSKGVKKEFMDVDRYDWFNPYMQYTGDEEIFKEEIDVSQTGTFGYTGAYMSKKQEVNQAWGGFIEQLKGWTFLDRYVEEGKVNQNYTLKIGPDFIRSKPSELDRFYISLTGNSLASYFHFIIDIENHIEANRPMAYNPQILG